MKVASQESLFLLFRRKHVAEARKRGEILEIWLRRELGADLPARLVARASPLRSDTSGCPGPSGS